MSATFDPMPAVQRLMDGHGDMDTFSKRTVFWRVVRTELLAAYEAGLKAAAVPSTPTPRTGQPGRPSPAAPDASPPAQPPALLDIAECRVCHRRFPHPAPGTGGTWTCSYECRMGTP